MTFRVSVTAVTLSTATLSLTAIQQPDPIRSSLDKARAAFDAEMPKHQQEVLDYFDKREQQARDQGNKKLVEELKSARQAFIDSGDIHSDALFNSSGRAQKYKRHSFKPMPTAAKNTSNSVKIRR